MKEAKPKTAVIVGYAPGREATPFAEPDKEFWGMNDLWAHWAMFPAVRPRWHRWFDMHRRTVQAVNARTGELHLQWLRELRDMPVYTLAPEEEWPTSTAYPLEAVWKDLGGAPGEQPYFTSTPAYMIALAIHERFERLEIYGVNLLGRDEYEYQRPCAEYWIGVARGRGIEVYLPPSSTLCRASFRYGYDTHGGPSGAALGELLRGHAQVFRQQAQQLQAQLAKLDGLREATEGASDLFAHYLRGGYIQPPAGLPPLPAHEQQKRDASLVAFGQVSVLFDRFRAGEQAVLPQLHASLAAMLAVPDQWESKPQ